MRANLTEGRIRAARAIAIAADLLQIGLFPLFFQGALSTVNDAVDVAVCAALVWLLGWHWALLPGIVAEAVPVLNLAPTWTAAVLLATRGGATVVPAEQVAPSAGPPASGPVIDVEARREDGDRH